MKTTQARSRELAESVPEDLEPLAAHIEEYRGVRVSLITEIERDGAWGLS